MPESFGYLSKVSFGKPPWFSSQICPDITSEVSLEISSEISPRIPQKTLNRHPQKLLYTFFLNTSGMLYGNLSVIPSESQQQGILKDIQVFFFINSSRVEYENCSKSCLWSWNSSKDFSRNLSKYFFLLDHPFMPSKMATWISWESASRIHSENPPLIPNDNTLGISIIKNYKDSLRTSSRYIFEDNFRNLSMNFPNNLFRFLSSKIPGQYSFTNFYRGSLKIQGYMGNCRRNVSRNVFRHFFKYLCIISFSDSNIIFSRDSCRNSSRDYFEYSFTYFHERFLFREYLQELIYLFLSILLQK